MKPWGNWVSVAVCAVVAMLPVIPPSLDVDSFPAARAMGHIAEIGRSPHPIGSAENERVRSYLVASLTDLGLSPQTQTVAAMDYFGEPGNTVDAVNVMARITGTGDGNAVALVAHYDTTPETPGANDDSASVAILLEVAAELMAGEPPENDVILLFTDGEEPAPRFGSRAFVDDHPWFSDVSFVMNLEASGSSGGSILAETSGPTEWLIGLVAGSARYPLTFSFFTELASSIGGYGTDFDPFREAGVPGLAFAYLHGSPIYHTARDSIDNVSLRSVQHQGANALALTHLLADTDLEPPRDASDSVFFTVGRWTIATYPSSWSTPIALAALIIFGFAVFGGPGRMFKGVAVVLGAFLAAAVGGALIWMLLTLISTAPSIWGSYLYLAALLSATGTWWWFLAKQLDPDTSLIGVVGVWLLFALVTSPLLPGVSYVFAWPALVGSLVVLAKPHGSIWSLPAVSLVSLVVTVPVVDFLFQIAQPRPGNPDSNLIPVAGAATALAILVIALIHSVWRASTQARPVTLSSSL